jgi:acetylornithine deacetylase/succinyl-diaminopimelate desuccinylase-like protein
MSVPLSSSRARRGLSVRRVASWILVASLACTAGLLSTGSAEALWPFDLYSSTPPLEERAATLLSEAIRIRTANPPGNEAALARKLAAQLGRAGIEHQVIPTPSPEGGPDRAAVWGRLRGRGERPALALLSHLDTVPANPEQWSVDPFAGEVWDGFVWGRGALDSKGVTVTHLMTLVELAESDEPLDRDLVFLATPEEETGGSLGAGWIAREHPELLEGVGFLLTEGGGIQAAEGLDPERPAIWGVSLTEKAPCWLELRAHGRAGHSSAPTPDAAVPRLISALDRIRRVESPVRVTTEVALMFQALAPFAPEWDRVGFQDLAHQLDNDEAFRRRFLSTPSQNALVRNTISITVLEGAPNTNVAPAIARAQLDARLLPGESCDHFASQLEALIDQPAIEIEEILSFPARSSDPDTPLFRAIETVAASQQPPGIVVPRMIGGFTDAHWFRELGIVSYGFVPRALPAEEGRRVHGIDERVRIDTLVRSIRLMIEITRTFDRLDRDEIPESER